MLTALPYAWFIARKLQVCQPYSIRCAKLKAKKILELIHRYLRKRPKDSQSSGAAQNRCAFIGDIVASLRHVANALLEE